MHRCVLRVLVLAFAWCISGLAWSGEAYPNKPVKLVVAFPPGNASDTIGRLLAKSVAQSVGQTFVIENRPGAGGTIGAEHVAKAAADGYTLLVSTIALPLTAVLYPNLKYDTAKDFASITVVMEAPLVLAGYMGMPPKSLRELIAYAKANPDKISYASAGVGTSTHVAMEKLKIDAGMDMQHVPYKGTGDGLYTDLLAGRVQLALVNIISFLPHYNGNRLRALAVTSLKRHPMLPDVPSISEGGVRDEFMPWNGFAAPAATPRDIINRLNREFVKALQLPEVRKSLLDSGAFIVGNSPEAADRQLKEQIERFGAVVRKADIKPE